MSADMKSSTNQQVRTQFEKVASNTRNLLEKFETTYARPALQRFVHHFHRRPIRTTFLATFIALSFLPVLSFIGFSLFVLAALVFFALSGALLVTFIITMFSGSILAFTLVILFGITSFLTTVIVSGYFILRLVTHIRARGPQRGTFEWIKETKDRLLTPSFSQSTPSSSDAYTRKQPHSATKQTTRRTPPVPSNRTTTGGDDDFADASSQPISSGASDTSTADSTVVVEGLDQQHQQLPLLNASKPYADIGKVSDEKPMMGIGGDSPIMVKKDLDFDRF